MHDHANATLWPPAEWEVIKSKFSSITLQPSKTKDLIMKKVIQPLSIPFEAFAFLCVNMRKSTKKLEELIQCELALTHCVSWTVNLSLDFYRIQ